MNPHAFTSYARIALLAVAASVAAGCAYDGNSYDPYRTGPYPYDPYYHDGPRVTYYDYWYYPSLGCYYDTRTRYYIYFEHDHWVRARALPPHLRPHLGSHVVVRSPHDRPYEYHHRHREQYAPERYRKPPAGGRGDDVWLGPPRRETPARDRDERRREYPERERNGYDRPRERNDYRNDYRGAMPRMQAPRMRDQEPRAQEPNAQIKAAPERRPLPAATAPVSRKLQQPAPVIRAVEQRGTDRGPGRGQDERHGNTDRGPERGQDERRGNTDRGPDRAQDERRGNGRHEDNGDPQAVNPGRGAERHPDNRYGRGGPVADGQPPR